MTRQRESAVKLATELRELAASCKRGEVKELPSARQFGLVSGRIIRLGGWAPAQMSETGLELRLDATGKITHAGDVVIELDYTGGAHGLSIDRVALLADGKEVSADEHGGWAGGGSHENVYRLKLADFSPTAKYEIVAKAKSAGGTDSAGDIWLILPD
jgi:hexosaminidase